MRHSSRVLSVAALTGALSLVAAPALANGSGQYVDTPPWTWYIAAGSGEWGVSEGSYSDGVVSVANAWAGSELMLLGPTFIGFANASATIEPVTSPSAVTVACVTSTLTPVGDDQVVSCNDTTTTDWGLSVTSEVRVLAPGDLARITYLITNTTSDPVVLGYYYAWNYGSSVGHVRSTEPDVVQDTGAGDGFLANPDVWSFNQGIYDPTSLNAGVAWGIGGQPFTGSTSEHSGFDRASVTLLPSDGRSIAAGETIALAFFHKMQVPAPVIIDPPDPSSVSAAALSPANSFTDTPAQFMAEFATFNGRLTRGIPTGLIVGNWQPAGAPELAATGAGIDENLLMGGLAAALLGTGAALLTVRRRVIVNAQR
ncbi:MAG: hypothetical protein RLZZ608_1384 [Actinomycetota bacterium]|jgi:hypothetical protein